MTSGFCALQYQPSARDPLSGCWAGKIGAMVTAPDALLIVYRCGPAYDVMPVREMNTRTSGRPAWLLMLRQSEYPVCSIQSPPPQSAGTLRRYASVL